MTFLSHEKVKRKNGRVDIPSRRGFKLCKYRTALKAISSSLKINGKSMDIYSQETMHSLNCEEVYDERSSFAKSRLFV
jgi:hypothetical protein